ncbi:hypothetical protein B0H11DRAFT_499471 [Mycena galericulata]|nr:hypothetical protein B0H11DRAFT_499471 [Mycena galericulata]
MLPFKVSFPSSARSHYYYTGSSSISFVAASSTKPSFVMLSIMLYNPAVRSCPFSTHRKFNQGPCRSAAVAPRGRMSLRLASVLHIARRLSTLTYTTTCASHKYVLLLSSLTCELIQLRRCVVWNIRFVFYSTKLPPTDKSPIASSFSQWHQVHVRGRALFENSFSLRQQAVHLCDIRTSRLSNPSALHSRRPHFPSAAPSRLTS